MSFLKNALKATGNKFAGAASEGILGDIEEFMDTGSYSLNAIISGSIYGGFPVGRASVLAAESSCGKSIVLLTTCREFQKTNPEGVVFYFESESALTNDQLRKLGIDLTRFVIMPVATIEEFRHQCVNVLDEYDKTPVEERPKMFICLDSLGMLSSKKEVSDVADGKDTRDMTKAQLVKGTFRVLTLKLGRLKVPMGITVHTYASMGGMYPTQEIAGGSGTIYASSSIVQLFKRKEKGSDGEQSGVNIRAKMYKSRLTRENEEHYFILDFERGMQRYSGLTDLAVEAGIFKKISTRLEMPDGSKMFQSQVERDPERWFTKDILDQIDEFCKTKFRFGSQAIIIPDDELVDDSIADVTIDQLEE